MTLRQGYLHDYLTASFIAVAFGMLVASPAGSAAAAGDWGKFIGAIIVAGLFGFVPGGLIAGYVSFRFHQMGDNSELSGLSAGFFAALVYTVIDLVITLVYVIMGADPAKTFIAWIITVVFVFLFYCLGGYLSGMMEKRPFVMPGIFDLSHISRAPLPPPPTEAFQTCPTCGGPLTYVQQYDRWYCPNCKKYP
jgi:hypothetical protein